MKNLFKIILLSAIMFVATGTVFAQHPKTYPIQVNINQGNYGDIAGINLVPRDSLLVTDSASYIIPITHTNDLSHFIQFNWLKIGAGTATLKMEFFQSNDPTTFFAVPKGAANAAYVKTYTLAASAQNIISFNVDTAKFEGRYLKVRLTTTSTASVKGKYALRVKTNFK